jgi:integrase
VRAERERERERKWPQAVERWMDTEFVKLREATQRRYETSIRMLHPHWAGLFLSQITSARVSDYATTRIKAGVSPATVRRDLATASRVFKIARRAGWVEHNPIPDEKGELSERRDPVEPVSLRYIAQAINAAPPGLAELIRFAARTGCRQEEAGSLERRNVNFEKRTITFIKTKTRSPRTIGMTPPVRRLLASVLGAGAPAEQPVFATAMAVGCIACRRAGARPTAGQAHRTSASTTCAIPMRSAGSRQGATSTSFRASWATRLSARQRYTPAGCAWMMADGAENPPRHKTRHGAFYPSGFQALTS